MSAKQIEIGIRWHPEHGHRFFGIDEVNECLKQGAAITSIEQGGVLMQASVSRRNRFDIRCARHI